MSHDPSSSCEFPVSGVPVKFPYTAYRSQKAMIYKIISAIKAKKNVLLESPTGSGKTLSLLCSTLAWQLSEYERVESDLFDDRKRQMNDKLMRLSSVSDSPIPKQVAVDNECDDDFKEPFHRQIIVNKLTKPVDILDDLTDDSIFHTRLQAARKSVPKIFFGSRTHKQLAQVIGELKKTEYCSKIRMTILASRRQLCINEKATNQDMDLNEGCKALLRDKNGVQCSYYSQLKRFDQNPPKLRKLLFKVQRGSSVHDDKAHVWDIEDLAQIGDEHHFCPYFAATSTLMQDANVIFAPYNYLVDPLVRERMKLNVKNQIILIDEAHNIEDCCRDSLNFVITRNDLEAERESLELAAADSFRQEYIYLKDLCSKMISFIDAYTINTQDLHHTEYGKYYKIWSSADIVVQLNDHLGVNNENYSECLTALRNINEAENECNKSDNSPKHQGNEIVQVAKPCMEKFCAFITYFFKENLKFMEDFRLGLASERVNYSIVYSLKIWCLNPAVAFSDIGPEAWSVILASGTLSPLDTFESELGVQFPLRLEADHVLPAERMMIRGIGRGPNNFPLKALYSETQNFKFMDELGSLLLRISRTVPAGVLCFLPSYSLLNNLEQRWRDTKLWKMMSVYKLLVKEPRTTSEMKERMTEFISAIKNPFQYGDDCTGSLLLAVYRGKVAEGIDFADDLARAVICVGIPYANVKVPEIDLKRKYNDQWRISRKLLSGQEWYENQAYRALNQALGRCLRHRKDWGALLLVDERFSNASRVQKLSKWMRANFKYANNFEMCANELDGFATKMARENDAENLVPNFSVVADISSCADSSNASDCDLIESMDIFEEKVISNIKTSTALKRYSYSKSFPNSPLTTTEKKVLPEKRPKSDFYRRSSSSSVSFENRDFSTAKDPPTPNPLLSSEAEFLKRNFVEAESSTISSAKSSPSPRRFTFTTKRNRYAIFTESPSTTDDGDVIVVDNKMSSDNSFSQRQITIDDEPKTNGQFFTRMVTLKRSESQK